MKVLKSEDHAEELRFREQTYGEDVNTLSLFSQLPLFKLLFGENEAVFFDNILKRVTIFKPAERCLVGEVVTICKLLHVNPATSASAERSFSMARRLKTWLRCIMKQGRFNNLAILKCKKKRADMMSLVDIAKDFVLNENRHRNFGKFTPKDLHWLQFIFTGCPLLLIFSWFFISFNK